MQTDTMDVTVNGAPPPGDAGKGKGKEPETVTLTKAEVEALKREASEARASERYWAERARGTSAATAHQEEVEDEIDPDDFIDPDDDKPAVADDDPAKLVDELSSKGIEAIKKRGFVTAADAKKIAVEVGAKVARELIDRERQKMSSDGKIVADFPELNNENSDLFKKTAVIYRELIALDPNAKKTPATLYAAARTAKAQLEAETRAAGSRRRTDEEDGDRYDRYDRDEEDRRTRAAAQDTSRNGRGPSRDDDEEDMLGPEAKSIIATMGIKPEDFMAERKKLGVRPRGGRR